jgi:putative ABC transport system ATP-binding protein
MASEPAFMELTGVDKVYGAGDAAVHALRSVDLRIAHGEFVAIMGPSGSGKTTLLNILGCLDRPTAGSYRLLGEEVAHHSLAELARVRNRVLGFVFQNFVLLPRATALDNVQLPLVYGGVRRRERVQRATETLQRVGLGARLAHRPNQLSGGQQQRVAIARAFANDPAIILADEPTGNLDLRTGKEIISLLKDMNMNKNVTVISATHDLKMIDVSDRVLWIRDGKIDRIEERADIKLRVGEMEGEES